jgi:hypothetical protein
MEDVNEVPYEFSLDEINDLISLLSDEMASFTEEQASDRQVESLAGVDVDIPGFHSSQDL